MNSVAFGTNPPSGFVFAGKTISSENSQKTSGPTDFPLEKISGNRNSDVFDSFADRTS